MKQLLIAVAIATPLLAGAPARAADVGISVQISQPGVYGRIDIGEFPRPAVVLRAPLIIARPSVAPPPVYMWVPPEHRHNWKHYCGRYHACGVPVYFVRDDWYRDHVRPHERDRGRHDDHDHGHDRHDHDDHGHGHGDGGRDHGHD
jgi:hypothetical protein